MGGDPDRHQPQVPRHDPVFVEGQVLDCLEADQGGRPVRLPPEAPDRTRTLCLRRRPLLRRTLCSLGVVGPHPQALGLGYRILHSQVRVPHQGGPLRGLLRRQQADRSGSRDKTIKLWNTLAQCKYTIQEEAHNDWVSCVRFSPNNQNPTIVSCGWDKYVKVWSLQNCKLKTDHIGHTGYLNTVTMSPDGSLCASGGKDAKAMLWDLNDGKHLYTLDHADTINALTFSPNRYWLCAATGPSIKIWDLESKNMVEELRPEVPGNSPRAGPPQCLSMAWSSDGQTLFAGYSDNVIRVWQVSQVSRG